MPDFVFPILSALRAAPTRAFYVGREGVTVRKGQAGLTLDLPASVVLPETLRWSNASFAPFVVLVAEGAPQRVASSLGKREVSIAASLNLLDHPYTLVLGPEGIEETPLGVKRTVRWALVAGAYTLHRDGLRRVQADVAEKRVPRVSYPQRTRH